MKNRPNEMMTLGWLLPLFDQQLSKVSDGWQVESHPDFEYIAQHYHQLCGALNMANLPRFAVLASKLSLLAEIGSCDEIDAGQSRKGQFAHQLLQHELTNYAQTGTYRNALLDKTIDELTQTLPQTSATIDDNIAMQVVSSANNDDDNEFIQNIDVIIPNVSALTALQPQQYQQLLVVWRQQVQQLFATNSNQSIILASLGKVSRYLWQATDLWQASDANTYQRLWYLTELWFINLADNLSPLPEKYAKLLSRLDQVLAAIVNKADDSGVYLSSDAIEGLIVDIYVQISGLATINAHTQSILSHLSSTTDANIRFLTRILAEIGSVISGLDKPQTFIIALQQIKRQFGQRGWILYESQVDQILADVEDSMVSETVFTQMQGQIERQLQELYSTVYNTEQSIRNKIGDAASFAPVTTLFDSIAMKIVEPPFMALSDATLCQLRIAVENVKHNFNDCLQGQQTYLLSTSDAFAVMSNTFDDMGLPSVRHVSDKLGGLFTQLENLQVKTIGWKLTQALAESVTTIELLLDYLAQHIFDQQLLKQANERIEQARELLRALIAAPETVTDTCLPAKLITSDVIRYGDRGEIVPTNIAVDSKVLENGASAEIDRLHSADKSNDSAALQAARTQLKPDNFEIDEEIRDAFIEEATEIVDDLKDFLPIWQQDAQDLSPLTELRRGFRILKESGRAAGAFSISEIAAAIENLLNQVLDESLSVNDDVVALVTQNIEHLPVLVADYTAQQAPCIDPAITILQSNNLLMSQPLSYGMSALELSASSLLMDVIEQEKPVESQRQTAEEHDISEVTISEVATAKALDTETNVTVHGTLVQDISIPFSNLNMPQVLELLITQASQLPVDAQDADPDIKKIFIEEAEEVLATIIPQYGQWRTSPSELTELIEVRRGFHTLKGSGRMVGAYYTGELAWAIEDMLNRILDHSIAVSADIIQLIADVLAAYLDLIHTFANNSENYPAIVPLWVACAQAYSKQYGNEFSYCSLRMEWLAADEQRAASNDDTNIMLEAVHSINEVMADTAVMTSPQSQEEQAFYEIFIEEAQELLQDINNFVSAHYGEAHVEVVDEIVRAFHTLRAASGSSALTAISDVSETVERSLERLQRHDTPMTAQHLQALARSVALIGGYLNTYEQNLHQKSSPAKNIQNKQDLDSLQAMFGESEDALMLTDSKLSVAQLLEADIDALLDAEWQLDEALNTQDIEQIRVYVRQQIEQIKCLADKTSKSPKFNSLLDALSSVYNYLDNNPLAAHNTEMQAALLAGHQQLIGLFDALAASMSLKVDQQVIIDLYAVTKKVTKKVTDSHSNPFNNNDDIEKETVEETDKEISAVDITVPIGYVQSTQADELQLETIDAELLEIFLEEAQALDSAIARIFNKWHADTFDHVTLKLLQRHLHTIESGARIAGILSIGDLAHEAEKIYEAFAEQKLQPTLQWLTIMQMVQDTLSLQIDYLGRYQASFFAHELIEQLQQFEHSGELPNRVVLILPAPQSHTSNDVDGVINNDSTRLEHDAKTISLDSLIAQSWANDLPDLDILEVFLEEADEIIVSSNKCLQSFLSNTSDVAALRAMQRDLHTIKGGARMVAANGIADLAHQMETVYEELAIRQRPATKMVSQLLMSCHDWLADAVFILKQQVNPSTPTTLIAALQQFSKNPDSLKHIPSESLQGQRRMILAAKIQQQTGRVVEDINEMPPMAGSFVEQEKNVASNEMIRIPGGLIEHMINLSGESTINRARIDIGITSLTNSIEEMGDTVQRLADQLRRMESELETQILSQIDDEELINQEDFDPLEMDQYSSLNQLSKSLTESASDLIDINSTLLEKTRDSESLLLQLSRTQAELQDGLMSSRMVPFTHLIPRLERVVRQTANELNKSVKLKIINADDEMDKTILERITSPLEHMLRNAVDHGIENTQTRLTAGKDRSGHIALEVLREGSEVVINLTDDGRGIDVDAVRNKAIAQGLIDPDDNSLSDLDIIQYIFNAGLTTTQQVTQISGRGVGMDVVISEIRQLGGVVSVTSELGHGARFTIRVPLTVAISDALVVRAADRYYAIPLVQIERVVRINPEKLYNYYKSGATTLPIEGDDYRIRYLNEVLSGNKLNELVVNTNASLPLIIVKNRTGQKLALQVDQIAGSRIEVVVKPLGRQLSYLEGISAATIMGDGSVMFILDIIALMRHSPALKDVTQSAKSERSGIGKQLTILVVDDSVTVRKVTSRLLERQGINVVVAKDGIDAIEILQETIPDLILLDIEMPRMDGFEVATQVRHNKRLQQIPIIMITSRTGEKHRARALDIGVNDYMGKPFQENELLDKIQALLSQKISLSYDRY